MPSIQGTVVEKRINDLTDKGLTDKPVYKLKAPTKTLNLSKNRSAYTEEHIESMKKELKDMMLFFGYTNNP